MVEQPPGRPSETFLQNDINRSIEYRKEYYKYALGIATALLAFTVSFQPQLSGPPEMPWLVYVGWAGLGAAVIAGVRVHMVWSKFFISKRNFDNRGKREEGDAVRRRLTKERRILDVALIAGMSLGVVGVVAFTSVNLKHVASKADDKLTAAKEANAQPAAPNHAPVPSSSEASPATVMPATAGQSGAATKS